MFKFVDNEKRRNCRLCEETDKKDNMVSCDDCERWFHLSCVNLLRRPTEEKKFLCQKCEYLCNERDINNKLAIIIDDGKLLRMNHLHIVWLFCILQSACYMALSSLSLSVY